MTRVTSVMSGEGSAMTKVSALMRKESALLRRTSRFSSHEGCCDSISPRGIGVDSARTLADTRAERPGG